MIARWAAGRGTHSDQRVKDNKRMWGQGVKEKEQRTMCIVEAARGLGRGRLALAREEGIGDLAGAVMEWQGSAIFVA